MAKKVVDNVGSFYQHYPRIALIVTASYGGKENAMTIAWHMPMSKDPPLIAFVTGTSHFTYKLIKQSGEFAINLLPETHAEIVAAIGGSKGETCDKFATYGIAREKSLKTSAPILADAYAAFECKVVEEKIYDGHSMITGEVVATHIQEGCIWDDGTVNMEKVIPVLYMGSEQYLNIEQANVRTLKRDIYARELKL
ncbi:MAG: flavin reductase family protein [Dehalococcoidales bacterium]|nr:flavin reductase family protein [Dehalococcoidales bacterium]